MGEDVLVVLRKTRKAFLLEYLCGLFLLGLLVVFYVKGMNLNQRAWYFVLGLGLFAITSGEVSRWLTKYKIEEAKLTIINGLIKQDKKHVYFYSLGFATDINVKQGRIARLLNYGTISLEGQGGTTTFEVKDIDHPHDVLNKIEELIKINQKKAHEKETYK